MVQCVGGDLRFSRLMVRANHLLVDSAHWYHSSRERFAAMRDPGGIVLLGVVHIDFGVGLSTP